MLILTCFHHSTGYVNIMLASFPGLFEKSEKIVCYPLFAGAPTSREVQILPGMCYVCVLWHQECVYCHIFNCILFIITTCMHNLFYTPSIDFAVKRWCSIVNRICTRIRALSLAAYKLWQVIICVMTLAKLYAKIVAAWLK